MMIHQIFWPFKDKELSEIPVFKKNVKRTKQFCKENNYHYKMWDLKDCEELVVEKYPEYICLWSEFRFDIQRCDFIRYLIFYSCLKKILLLYHIYLVDCKIDNIPLQILLLLYLHQHNYLCKYLKLFFFLRRIYQAFC